MSRTQLLQWWVPVIALFCLVQPIKGQVDTGTILGTVRDSSGAVVPGAKVTVSNVGTSFTESTNTSGSGTYVFTPLRIGTYTVEVEQVDFSLSPGEVTTTVDVTGEAPVLQTENGSVGQVVGSQSVNDLPLNGRNY